MLIVFKLKFQDFRFEYLVEVDWLWDKIKRVVIYLRPLALLRVYRFFKQRWKRANHCQAPAVPAEIKMKAFSGIETMKTSSSSCSTGHSQAQLKVTSVSGNALSSILICSLPINRQRALFNVSKTEASFTTSPATPMEVGTWVWNSR